MTLTTQVGPDTFVTIAYTLYDEDGDVIDRSDAEEPLTYVHGYGQIVPGLEQAMEGMERGQTRSVVIPPDKGYGEYDEDGVFEVERSEFPDPENVKVDDEFVAEGPDGDEVAMRIVEVGDEAVVVDTNHPLAGETLRFDVQVLDVRPATGDEIAEAERAFEDAHAGCDDPTHDHGAGVDLIWPGKKPKDHGPS